MTSRKEAKITTSTCFKLTLDLMNFRGEKLLNMKWKLTKYVFLFHKNKRLEFYHQLSNYPSF